LEKYKCCITYVFFLLKRLNRRVSVRVNGEFCFISGAAGLGVEAAAGLDVLEGVILDEGELTTVSGRELDFCSRRNIVLTWFSTISSMSSCNIT